jgi:hypothetical protein
MTQPVSPFVPGATVAVSRGQGRDREYYSKRVVEKVYKNGNFTLQGDRQQYRPSCWASHRREEDGSYKNIWRAEPTGESRTYRVYSVSVRPWDEELEEELNHRDAERALKGRADAVRHRVYHTRVFTPEQLEALERLFPAPEEGR